MVYCLGGRIVSFWLRDMLAIRAQKSFCMDQWLMNDHDLQDAAPRQGLPLVLSNLVLTNPVPYLLMQCALHYSGLFAPVAPNCMIHTRTPSKS